MKRGNKGMVTAKGTSQKDGVGMGMKRANENVENAERIDSRDKGKMRL